MGLKIYKAMVQSLFDLGDIFHDTAPASLLVKQ